MNGVSHSLAHFLIHMVSHWLYVKINILTLFIAWRVIALNFPTHFLTFPSFCYGCTLLTINICHPLSILIWLLLTQYSSLPPDTGDSPPPELDVPESLALSFSFRLMPDFFPLPDCCFNFLIRIVVGLNQHATSCIKPRRSFFCGLDEELYHKYPPPSLCHRGTTHESAR